MILPPISKSEIVLDNKSCVDAWVRIGPLVGRESGIGGCQQFLMFLEKKISTIGVDFYFKGNRTMDNSKDLATIQIVRETRM